MLISYPRMSTTATRCFPIRADYMSLAEQGILVPIVVALHQLLFIPFEMIKKNACHCCWNLESKKKKKIKQCINNQIIYNLTGRVTSFCRFYYMDCNLKTGVWHGCIDVRDSERPGQCSDHGNDSGPINWKWSLLLGTAKGLGKMALNVVTLGIWIFTLENFTSRVKYSWV